MSILNIAGYTFISLTEIPSLREILHQHCRSLAIKGTVLLSNEGININLAGTQEAIISFKSVISFAERTNDKPIHSTSRN